MNKVNWMTSTHLSSKKTLTNGPALTLKFLIKFINLHTRENQYLSLRYIMHINASTNTPFYTHVVHMWYEESTPRLVSYPQQPSSSQATYA